MLESNENIEEPLLSDDQPSWVTLNASQSEDADLPWDRPEPQPAEPADDLWPRSRPPTATKESGENNLPKIVLFMRLGNMVAAGLLVFGSIGSLTNIFSLPVMVLAGYGICFGSLICCLEINISFIRQPIASNFGFLYNPFYRLIFYVLMGMVAWSFGTLLGIVASGALMALSLINTYVLCRYPGYKAALKEASDEEEKRLKRGANRAARKHAWGYVTRPWWANDDE
ncbi:predicted protein [Thalassiosira pseudonana CCMP1335]|uniref:Uncharacterized protein n=1 Tax=Thalassiosira pseudonana TaxID=35128 RepID=B8C7D3_THAPS|nr:predicted protein [Thalassiosira pseudonana CCMP1335]EED90727.1 predicted protein [Thalassiosira pseudonana CCMP1335]